MGRQGHKGREASIHAALDDFVTKLMRKRLGGSSLALARHTTEVLIHAVAAQQAPTAEGIIEGVRAVSKKLVEARPLGASEPQNPCALDVPTAVSPSHSFASKNTNPQPYFPHPVASNRAGRGQHVQEGPAHHSRGGGWRRGEG